MSTRKTINRDKFIKTVNAILKSNSTTAEREVITILANDLLLGGNCYNGFRYLGVAEVPEDALPGIRGAGTEDNPYTFDYIDTSRVEFY